jgi:hypothetical protein
MDKDPIPRIVISEEEMAFCQARDRLAAGLQPSNTFEMRLLHHAVEAEQSLTNARTLEKQLYAENTPSELLKKIDLVKTVTRIVAQADRIWRQSLAEFYRAQRNRVKAQKEVHFSPPLQNRHLPEIRDWSLLMGNHNQSAATEDPPSTPRKNAPV